jgi:putative phosphoesterase
MLIGVVSDTHGYFHPELADVLAGVDLILHAGDVGDAAILDGLKAVAPVRAVFGNVDGHDVRSRRPEEERFEAGGLDVWMTHIAGRPGRWQRGMGRRLAEEGPPDVFVCGHSHILQIERVADLGGMLFLNPGAAGRQGLHQHKTCVRLTVEDGRATSADVVHLDKQAEGNAQSVAQ